MIRELFYAQDFYLSSLESYFNLYIYQVFISFLDPLRYHAPVNGSEDNLVTMDQPYMLLKYKKKIELYVSEILLLNSF